MNTLKTATPVATVKELKGLRALGENKGAVANRCHRRCGRGCHRRCSRRCCR
jgi:hypothetical protein